MTSEDIFAFIVRSNSANSRKQTSIIEIVNDEWAETTAKTAPSDAMQCRKHNAAMQRNPIRQKSIEYNFNSRIEHQY